MRKHIHHPQMIRFLLLCLCAVLLCGTASAGDNVEILERDRLGLVYADTLSDGRVLLAGYVDRSGGAAESVPRLLCLNKDRTVSWDYRNEAFQLGRYIGAAELTDGRIGAVIWDDDENAEDGFILQFLTPEGEPAGQEIRIPVSEHAYINCVTASRLVFADQETNMSFLYDWDGNEIVQTDEPYMGVSYKGMIEEPDALVMIGAEPGGNHYAGEIVKTDLQGNLIWKSVPPCVWTDKVQNQLPHAISSQDGGYLEVQSEPMLDPDRGIIIWKSALVKLDSDGKILWVTTEGLEDEETDCRGLVRYGGKIAAFFETRDNEPDSIRDIPLMFRWFDEDGHFLGTTEMNLSEKDLTQPGLFSPEQAEADILIDVRYDSGLIPAEDGLWALASVLICAEDGGYSSAMLMVKVPEL